MDLFLRLVLAFMVNNPDLTYIEVDNYVLSKNKTSGYIIVVNTTSKSKFACDLEINCLTIAK